MSSDLNDVQLIGWNRDVNISKQRVQQYSESWLIRLQLIRMQAPIYFQSHYISHLAAFFLIHCS
jgi:hypothetical protein